MAKPGAESAARRREGNAAVGRAVIEIEDVGPAVFHHRAREELQHRLLALVGGDAEAHDGARGVVEHCVHAHMRAPSVEGERRAVADVAVPEGIGTLGLPAQARPRALGLCRCHAWQALLAQHPPHRALLHLGANPSVGPERAQHQRHAHVGVFPADVTQQLFEDGIEVPTPPAIAAALGRERRETAFAARVEPALERGDSVAAGRVATRRPHALRADAPQLLGALAVLERPTRELADEGVAKQRYFLEMILGGQTFHTASSAGFSSPASLSCAGLGRAGPILRGGFRVAGPAGTRRPSARRDPRARARRGSRRDRRSLEGSRHQIVPEVVARARGERVSDALGHLAAVSTADTRDAEQAAGLRGIDPARERDPALVGRGPNGPRGARRPTDRGAALAASVSGDRGGDRASAVPSPARQPGRAHDEDRPACPATVPPHRHHPRPGRLPGTERAELLPLVDPMSNDAERAAYRARRSLAARAARRPRLHARRHPVTPGLDS